MLLTNTGKIANPSITLTLVDGYSVQLRQLSIGKMADLEAYARGKFMQNTFNAIKWLDTEYQNQVIQNMAIAAQQMVWSDNAATAIFESEEDGLAFYTFKYVEDDFKGNFNDWKELFNKDRIGNVNRFYVARWVLYFSIHPITEEVMPNPNILYEQICYGLDKGLPLNIILASTPTQIRYLLGDRQAMENLNNGTLNFRDQEEFRAWYEAQKQKNIDEVTDANREAG